MKKLKIIIAGSRTVTNKKHVHRALNKSKILPEDVKEIISGGAKGVDSIGEQIAKSLGIAVKLFPANWDTYGKSAGYRRNAQMAAYADVLIAVQKDNSKGTGHMIDLMRKQNKPTYVLEI